MRFAARVEGGDVATEADAGVVAVAARMKPSSTVAGLVLGLDCGETLCMSSDSIIVGDLRDAAGTTPPFDKSRGFIGPSGESSKVGIVGKRGFEVVGEGRGYRVYRERIQNWRAGETRLCKLPPHTLSSVQHECASNHEHTDRTHLG